jgi:hypothetical protein
MSALNGTTKLQYSFWPKSEDFIRPHIIRVRGRTIWVGEIADQGGVLWSFDIKESNETMRLSSAELYMSSDSTNSDVGNSFLILVLVFASISIAGFVAFMRYRDVSESNVLIDRTVCLH